MSDGYASRSAPRVLCIFADPLQRSQAFHRWNSHKTFMFCSLLTRCRIRCACHKKRCLRIQKWIERAGFSTSLASKCVSRQNGVRFVKISTLKSVLVLRWFYMVLPFSLGEIGFESQHQTLFLLVISQAAWLRAFGSSFLFWLCLLGLLPPPMPDLSKGRKFDL